MTRDELFLKSHEELLHSFKLINHPMYYSPLGALPDGAFSHLGPDNGIFGYSKIGEAIEPISPLPSKLAEMIVRTFCKSHLRLLKKK